MVIPMKSAIKIKKSNLSNLNYYVKQTPLRIAECDRMLQLKKHKTAVTKEERKPTIKATTITHKLNATKRKEAIFPTIKKN